MSVPTNEEIATSWSLWAEHAGDNWTEADFDAMSFDERMDALVEMFGDLA